MNIYRCWYQGIKGYSCRDRNKNWLFVPDTGQPDNRSYRKIDLLELDFLNRHEKKFELNYEASLKKHPVQGFFKNLLGRGRKPVTVYGQLLLPS